MRPRARILLWALALAAAAPRRAPAQEVLGRAMDLEQVGQWNEAATLYRQVLAEDPASAGALLGLERVMVRPAQRDSVLAFARRAIAASPAASTGYAVELRVLRAMGQDSLARGVLEQWVAVDPTGMAPYREWARLSFTAGRLQDARDAVVLARQRLRNGTALAPEMAQLEAVEGDWGGAAAEWRAAVQAQPAYVEAAGFSLRPAPAGSRDAVLRALISAPDARRIAPDTSDAPPAGFRPVTSASSGSGALAGRRVAADLLLGWNEPGRAWDLLRDVLPAADSQRVPILRAFAERAQSLGGPDAQRAAAGAYELLARAGPPEEAGRMRVEGARSYAAAGDTADAGRVLRALAGDASADPATRTAAAAAMVELLVREGRPAEAERALEGGAGIPGTDRTALARAIAGAWLRLGALDRAARAVAGDSSLAGDEVRGWVALYGGNLAEARRLLRNAGATVGERGLAPARAAAVALLEAVGRDSLPELGAALLLAARGDSLRSSRALVAVARALGGAAEDGEAEPALLAWAARLAAGGRDAAGAEALWREVAERFDSSRAAPEADLALARALADRGDVKGAAARLEAMILAHPQSALVPEARRELDRVRGLVPRS
jgi:tetratricopeptide (TPR) repeat protein